jgi:hypothetical protein
VIIVLLQIKLGKDLLKKSKILSSQLFLICKTTQLINFFCRFARELACYNTTIDNKLVDGRDKGDRSEREHC